MAIRKLERAGFELLNSKISNIQIDIFTNVSFGSMYESYGLNLMAMRYYAKAKFASDKSYILDPDTALTYCYLGSLFIKLREYEWSLRCYLKAKEIRENSLGGDTVDTSTVYNNLGVCCFYLQYYLPAKAYLDLSYEINKSHLG
jgi:tetratricopeptide (TPR) repeat protein